jgi:hypothetical protein
MLNIITNKTNEVQYYNDSYFDIYTCCEKITDKDKEYMKKIDNSTYINADRIITDFGETNIEHISTGCKTIINIVHHPEIIFSLAEVGGNVINEVFKLAESDCKYTVYMNRMALPDGLFISGLVMVNGVQAKNVQDFIRIWEDDSKDSCI